METKPLGTDEEIREFIKKNYGSYEKYRQQTLQGDSEPELTTVRVEKSAEQKLIEGFEAIAERQGITLEKYFQTHPGDYEMVKELGTVRV